MSLKIPKINSLYMPNLLINGDFQVWQRGKTLQVNGTGGSIKYYIDLWASYTGDWEGTLNKVENGVKINTSSANAYLLQNIDHLDLEIGTQYIVVASINNTIYKITFKYGIDTPITEHLSILKTNYDTFVNVRGLKNNDIVNWVQLNEGLIEYKHIKEDYSIALLRCQRRLLVLKGSFGGGNVYRNLVYLRIDLPTTIDVKPTISQYDIRFIIDGKEEKSCSNLTIMNVTSNSIFINATVDQFLDGNDGKYARVSNDSSITITCEPI